MSERFKELFSIKPYGYSPGIPVLIYAGRMLWDNFSNRPCVQLKLQSLSPKILQSVTVQVTSKDYACNAIETELYDYEQLNIARNQFFGEQEVIQLNNTTAVSFTVNIVKTVLYDNTVLVPDVNVVKQLPELTPLKSYLNNDAELEKQFQKENGGNHLYMPIMMDDIWRCSCGAINNKTELMCHKCRMSIDRDFNVDIDNLKKRKDIRLKKEAEERAVKEKKRKQIFIAGSIIFLAILILIVIIDLLIVPSLRHKYATDKFANGEYKSAYEVFKKNENFKDNKRMAEVAKQKYWASEFSKILAAGYEINTMNWKSTVNSEAVFGLAYINDDDIPELYVGTDDEKGYIYMIFEEDGCLTEPMFNQSLSISKNGNYEIGYYEKEDYVYGMYYHPESNSKNEYWEKLNDQADYASTVFNIYTYRGLFSGESKEYRITWSEDSSDEYDEEDFYMYLREENINTSDYKVFKLYNNSESNRKAKFS